MRVAWFEVWVEAGGRTRIERLFGTMAYALHAARGLAVSEQAQVELSFVGDLPLVVFGARGAPQAVPPVVLPGEGGSSVSGRFPSRC